MVLPVAAKSTTSTKPISIKQLRNIATGKAFAARRA
jgi:hypothetical protein